jgi:uncharacterized protein YdbL (DUF1318 family)
MSRVKASVSPLLAAVLLVPFMAGHALAQARDPAYAAARSAGQVGEMPTGYLGIVGASSPDLKRLVDDINIKRKAVYAERAQAQHATVEEYAFTTGCKLVLSTQPGEKYQTPMAVGRCGAGVRCATAAVRPER